MASAVVFDEVAEVLFPGSNDVAVCAVVYRDSISLIVAPLRKLFLELEGGSANENFDPVFHGTVFLSFVLSAFSCS